MAPFKIGDIIEINGVLGTVLHKGTFVFKIKTSNDKFVVFSNRTVYNQGINNLTAKNMMRLDLNVQVAYNSNMTKVKNTLMSVLNNNNLVLHSPSPKISVSRLREKSIDLTLSPWCEPDDYWTAYQQLQQELKSGLESQGVFIPDVNPSLVELRKVI